MKRISKDWYHALNPLTRAYLDLHICVFLWGFTAILGKLISIAALSLVWWRVGFTCLSLVFLKGLRANLKNIPRRKLITYMGIGILVCSHWIFFYASIKASNASVGVLCMAITPIFTSFLEPVFFKKRIFWVEILLSLLVVPGMYLVTQNISESMYLGLFFGLISSFMASLFSILNKKYITNADPVSITFLELGSAFIFLSIIMPFIFLFQTQLTFWPQHYDWIYLLLLSIFCTSIPYILSLHSLKHLSAFTTNLAINLEPIYGIFFAWILLKENKEVSPGFYLGVIIIMISVFSYPFLKKAFKPNSYESDSGGNTTLL